MIWLVLSVLFSSILYVIFKLFERYKINTLQAIVVNYAVAAITGILLSKNSFNYTTIINANWFPWAIFMGFLFIGIFNIMALTSQRNGLSVAAVAGKMSLVIPVVIGFIYYKEHAGLWKIIGICIALLAVYFTTTKAKTGQATALAPRSLIFPILLFIGSGVIDSIMKLIETRFMQPDLEAILSATIFFTALCIGIVFILYDYFKNNTPFEAKSIVAGIVLGVPNYFSIVFLFKALASFREASFVYPLNHVGIILLSTLLGMFLFREKLQVRNWIGIFLAIMAILCIAFAKA